MQSTTITAKGQVVIPAKIRKLLGLKKGTRLAVAEDGGRIILQPLTRQFFEKTAGVLKDAGLTAALLAERAKERKAEERKW